MSDTPEKFIPDPWGLLLPRYIPSPYTTLVNLVPLDFSPVGENEQAANELLNGTIQQQLSALMGIPSVMFDSPSTAVSVSPTTITETDIVSALEEMQRILDESDPLLQRGIQRDWVAVVHPGLVRPLIASLSSSPFPPLPGDSQHILLQRVTRRKTYIQNSAPPNAIEYMTELTYLAEYKEEILAGWAIHRLAKEGEARARKKQLFGSDEGL